jgi:mono/diheme cytochrome c family protein
MRHSMLASCSQQRADGVIPMVAALPGPQLMDTKRDDEFIRERIKNGKSGSMAFGSMFSDAQIDQIIKYIRELRPSQG